MMLTMDILSKTPNAFVLRIAPGRKDYVPSALEDDDLIIGWANANGLLDKNLTWVTFRKIIHDCYYSADKNHRRSGMAAGFLWLFIREMQIGDLVVVPHGSNFYVGEVIGLARYDDSKVEDDTAYRRKVKWLNDKKSFPRKFARAALQSRMKIQGTCANASDLLHEIKSVLETTTSFSEDFHNHLVQGAIEEIRSGKMDGAGFEQLIASLLKSWGGYDVRVIAHSQDKGVDVLAHFRVAGAIQLTIAVQAKHYKPDPPVDKKVIETLFQGMEIEAADIGMVITSGTFSPEAEEYVAKLYEEQGRKIELIDGEQLGALILEYGFTQKMLSY